MEGHSSEAVARIVEKLGRIRERGLTCFGSEKHGFRLNPVLAQPALEEFERQAGVRLPDGYREFLLEAGNGGAGPYYGLLPLESWNAAESEGTPDWLSRPSPLIPNMLEDVAWEETLGCAREELFQGTLTLVDQGCTYYALLVVSGRHRGRVVYVDMASSAPPCFMRDPDFLGWYERWLDELLWGYYDWWFGFGLPGREPELRRTIRDRGTPPDVLVDALITLWRIPDLQPDTAEAARPLLRHTGWRVRQRAIALVEKHRISGTCEDLKLLAQDENALVRKEAVAALAKSPGVAWEPIARQALRDEDRTVMFRALCLLKQAKLLQPADVEFLLQSPDSETRRYAAWAAKEME